MEKNHFRSWECEEEFVENIDPPNDKDTPTDASTIVITPPPAMCDTTFLSSERDPKTRETLRILQDARKKSVDDTPADISDVNTVGHVADR